MDTIKIRGSTIYYEDLNQENKEVILFVHGHPFDHTMWKYQYDTLANFRLILPDAEKSIHEYLNRNSDFLLFKRRKERAKKLYNHDYTLFECLAYTYVSKLAHITILVLWVTFCSIFSNVSDVDAPNIQMTFVSSC